LTPLRSRLDVFGQRTYGCPRAPPRPFDGAPDGTRLGRSLFDPGHDHLRLVQRRSPIIRR
jgi:hypothetical protein